MKIRNVRIEGGFKSGSVQVPCGMCGVRRRKTGRLYIRWILQNGKHSIGSVCGECLEREVLRRFDTYLPVEAAKKAKEGVCSCGRDAKGGVELILRHSVLEQEERQVCGWCLQILTRVEDES